jgi:hypothetical protein
LSTHISSGIKIETETMIETDDEWREEKDEEHFTWYPSDLRSQIFGPGFADGRVRIVVNEENPRNSKLRGFWN